MTDFTSSKLKFETFAEFQGTKRQSIRAVFVTEAAGGEEHRFIMRWGKIEALAQRSTPKNDQSALRKAGISKKFATELLARFDTINDDIHNGTDRHSNYPLIRGRCDYSIQNPFGIYLTEKPAPRVSKP